jgi:chemotaxis protein MotD
MTSGVKPALPPMLMMKAGIEGKGARSRAPQADFAEALGIGKQDSSKKSAAMKAEGGDPVTAWPRLGAKLGSAIERAHHAPLEPEVPTVRLNEEPGDNSGDDNFPDIDPDTPAEKPLERDGQQQNNFDGPAMGAEATVLPARQELSPRPGRQPVAAQNVETTRVLSDIEVQSSPAGAAGDNPPAGSTASPAIPSAEAPKAVSFVPLRANERTEPQQPQSATRPSSTASSSKEGQASGGDSLPEATEPVRAAPRVTVVSQQNVPAPMASTALVLVDSIAGSTLLGGSNTAPAPNAIHAAATHASAQSLKIQLHPAELGMVTATLRFAGERLSIELKVENPEAYRRLTSDSETIVGSLRDLGYDIDKVTVIQPSIASSSSQRFDTAATMHGPTGRSGDQPNSAMSNGGSAGSGENSSRNGRNTGEGSQKGPSARPETSDGGLYI